MFSLKEIEPNKFMYRCHECGWESEVMTKQEAIEDPGSHRCAPVARSGNGSAGSSSGT